jgi:DNA-binding NtrC family response regulator
MTTILLVVPDLFFSTRIEEAGKRLGYNVVAPSSSESLESAITRTGAVLVVISLEAPKALEAIASAKKGNARALAFGSHRNVEMIVAAHEAGADQVVARSLMAEDLPDLLQKWAG